MRSANNILRLCTLAGLLWSCQPEQETNQTFLFETMEAPALGIDFENTVVETDSLNILDYLYLYNGGGLAMGDVDGDGLLDLYFAANQGNNKLYLNKGDLQFEDVTQSAGVAGKSDWNTGSIMGDFNADGLLDIYVMAVVGINDFMGQNELFINNGDGTFTDQAATYGLDLQAFGTTAGQLDYDGDGDLDLFVLNHAVHTEESFGRARIREVRDPQTGDRLFRNDGDRYTDVSEVAGIYGGVNGYGLGLAIADFNKDGRPDIYVGNDFHEDDYYYINNGDGTFTDRLRTYFGHTSRFSMGSDAADINNDGWPDLISLDMSPEDEKVLKSSEGDDTYQVLRMRTQQYGYHYQFTRNMLFLNQGSAPYLETALMSGVAATDWSWSALFGDYDLDGNQDLFISNGITRRPNDLDFIRFVSNSEIQKQMNNSKLVDNQALDLMPSGLVNNYLFQGDGKGGFMDRSEDWAEQTPSVSSATVVGDLDGDGDLDLVTNNLNAAPTFYINLTDSGSYLTLKLEYSKHNSTGLGTEVYCYSQGGMQWRQLSGSRGWQASSAHEVHFGLDGINTVDSLRVVWPDRTSQLLTEIPTNQQLTIAPQASQPYTRSSDKGQKLFTLKPEGLGIDFVHQEDRHSDFDYQKLIPYEVSDRGPGVAVGDFNKDGKDDIFLGGAKDQPSAIYTQTSTGFEFWPIDELAKDSLSETVGAHYLSMDAGSQWYLSVANGGNHINPSLEVLQNSVLVDMSNIIELEADSTQLLNSSVYRAAEGGGIFLGNHSVPLDYGNIPTSYLLAGEWESDGKIGMVTDAVWDDFDGDGQTDLIVVGEWMAPKFFKNENGVLTPYKALESPASGLWQSIIPYDIDRDGDQDYLLGNWGLNSKFKASLDAPMQMYYDDFDDNGTTETVIAIERDGTYYPLLDLNQLAGQMVGLRKKFTAYSDFAGQSIETVMGADALKEAKQFEVHTLASGFLRNNNNTFNFEEFPSELQLAPIFSFVEYDFDGDGQTSVLAGGNYFGVIPFHGRYDSFPGAMIGPFGSIRSGNELGLEIEHRSVRAMKTIELNNQPYLIIVYNNDAIQVYEMAR